MILLDVAPSTSVTLSQWQQCAGAPQRPHPENMLEQGMPSYAHRYAERRGAAWQQSAAGHPTGLTDTSDWLIHWCGLFAATTSMAGWDSAAAACASDIRCWEAAITLHIWLAQGPLLAGVSRHNGAACPLPFSTLPPAPHLGCALAGNRMGPSSCSRVAAAKGARATCASATHLHPVQYSRYMCASLQVPRAAQ
jgi:hypothetical protein